MYPHPFVSKTTLIAPWKQRPKRGVKRRGKGWKGGEEEVKQADRGSLKRPDRNRKKGEVHGLLASLTFR